MTRENKLALVVGFGLILFVGILISDHFSVVRSQEPANLSMQQLHDPLAVTTAVVEPASLIELQQLRSEPAPEATRASDAGSADGLADSGSSGTLYEHSQLRTDVLTGDQPYITMDQTARPNDQPIPDGFHLVEEPKPGTPAQANFQFHDVQSGESMFAIARKYYGTSDAVESLARFNRMNDPSELRCGQRIRIPTAQELGLTNAVVAGRTGVADSITTGGDRPAALKLSSESTAQNAVAKATPKPRVTYTVKKGETLRVIALKVMGSKNKWNKLYDLNRDVIDDPDNLKVGTVLRLS